MFVYNKQSTYILIPMWYFYDNLLTIFIELYNNCFLLLYFLLLMRYIERHTTKKTKESYLVAYVMLCPGTPLYKYTCIYAYSFMGGVTDFSNGFFFFMIEGKFNFQIRLSINSWNVIKAISICCYINTITQHWYKTRRQNNCTSK